MAHTITVKNRIVDFATAKDRMKALTPRFLGGKLERPVNNENILRQRELLKAYVDRRAVGRF